MDDGESTGRSVMLTGWGDTVNRWATRITAHAVDAEQADKRLAVCGARVFDVDRDRPWDAQHAEVACRRCASRLTA
jgi:hypothetical protein